MRNKKTIIMACSLVIIVFLISTAMIPVLANSLSLSNAAKTEPEKIESEPTIADDGCSACGDSTQPTITTSISNQKEAAAEAPDPSSGEPCGCVESVEYAFNYAKEQEWENRPKIGDYVAFGPVKALFLWINGTRAWLADLANAINEGFQQKDFTPGFNVVKAIKDAFDFTINEILELLDLIPFPTVEAVMVLSELFLIFPTRALAYFIVLCLNDDDGSGNNNEIILETIQVSIIDTIETTTQQNQNV